MTMYSKAIQDARVVGNILFGTIDPDVKQEIAALKRRFNVRDDEERHVWVERIVDGVFGKEESTA